MDAVFSIPLQPNILEACLYTVLEDDVSTTSFALIYWSTCSLLRFAECLVTKCTVSVYAYNADIHVNLGWYVQRILSLCLWPLASSLKLELDSLICKSLSLAQ